MMLQILIMLTTVLMWGLPAFAASDTTSATFLKIGAGARAAGMGDAFCGLADDAYASYWNPAGLVQVKGSQFGLTHLSWLTEIKQEQIGFVQSIGKKTALGLNISHLMANDFERTNQEGIYGRFDAANSLLGLSLARQLGSRFSLGMNLKCVHLSMDDTEATAFGGDIGALWRIFQCLSLGLNVQNIGTGVKFIEKAYPLPFNVKAGVGCSLGRMNLVLDADKACQSGSLNISAGGEYWLAKTLALRLGMRDKASDEKHGKSKGIPTGVTAGIGLRLGGLQFDYAYVPYGSLDVTHRASLSVLRMPRVSPPVLPQHGTEALPVVVSQPQEGAHLEKAATATQAKAATISVTGTASIPVPQMLSSGTKTIPVIAPSSGKIVLPSFDLRFDTGHALINVGLYRQLEGLVEFMSRYPQVRIRIEGHTDNRCIDTPVFHSNQELSEARARVIQWYLLQQWIQAERMEIRGYSDTKPIASNDTPEGQAKNRRVEIVIIDASPK